MRLLPEKPKFYDLFDEHAGHLVTISRELRDLLETFDQIPERQARIKDLERRCDKITHALATEMHAAFVTPLDKEDIAALASGLDDVADYADAVAVRILLFNIPEKRPEAAEIAGILVQCTEVLKGGVACLRNTRDRDRIVTACRELHSLENTSDEIYRRAMGRLFNEPGADPMLVLKWNQIFERLEMAVDQCEDVSNVLESIQLKYS